MIFNKNALTKIYNFPPPPKKKKKRKEKKKQNNVQLF